MTAHDDGELDIDALLAPFGLMLNGAYVVPNSVPICIWAECTAEGKNEIWGSVPSQDDPSQVSEPFKLGLICDEHQADLLSTLLQESSLEVRTCRICGCTDEKACMPPCHWVEADLCSACQQEQPC